MDLDFVLEATKGQLLSRHKTEFEKVGTDSRVSLQNQLFIPLKGENFDAHQFLDQAVFNGAAALLIHQLPENLEDLKEEVTVIRVKDTLKALQDLGHHWRKKHKAKILALTGSNGKTTTKEFTATLISAYKKTQSNKGSFNNHWGVPLNLLEINDSHEFCIVEMGMNHSGEIAELMKIADPDVVTCTTVGTAHIEFFGSIEKIAQAKEEIYSTARPDALKIFNLDNSHTFRMSFKYLGDRLTYSGVNPAADVCLSVKSFYAKELVVEGNIQGVAGEVRVPIFGVQNVQNLMAAACLALAAGLTPAQIWQALPKCKTSWGRNQWIQLRNGAEMIFDAYNANPDSMKALLENIPKITVKGQRIGIFGEMRELGDATSKLHEELGQLVGKTPFDIVWFSGPHGVEFEKGLKKTGFSKTYFVSPSYDETLARRIASMIHQSDVVFVKGSRGNKLERFVSVCDPLDFETK